MCVLSKTGTGATYSWFILLLFLLISVVFSIVVKLLLFEIILFFDVVGGRLRLLGGRFNGLFSFPFSWWRNYGNEASADYSAQPRCCADPP